VVLIRILHLLAYLDYEAHNTKSEIFGVQIQMESFIELQQFLVLALVSFVIFGIFICKFKKFDLTFLLFVILFASITKETKPGSVHRVLQRENNKNKNVI
jgi:hypothetical protein